MISIRRAARMRPRNQHHFAYKRQVIWRAGFQSFKELWTWNSSSMHKRKRVNNLTEEEKESRVQFGSWRHALWSRGQPANPRVTPGPHVVNLIAYSWIVSAGIVVLIILLCSLQAMSMILPRLFMGFLLIPGKLPITDERLTMGPINTGHNHR